MKPQDYYKSARRKGSGDREIFGNPQYQRRLMHYVDKLEQRIEELEKKVRDLNTYAFRGKPNGSSWIKDDDANLP